MVVPRRWKTSAAVQGGRSRSEAVGPRFILSPRWPTSLLFSVVVATHNRKRNASTQEEFDMKYGARGRRESSTASIEDDGSNNSWATMAPRRNGAGNINWSAFSHVEHSGWRWKLISNQYQCICHSTDITIVSVGICH